MTDGADETEFQGFLMSRRKRYVVVDYRRTEPFRIGFGRFSFTLPKLSGRDSRKSG